jgi:hypothetical protein
VSRKNTHPDESELRRQLFDATKKSRQAFEVGNIEKHDKYLRTALAKLNQLRQIPRGPTDPHVLEKQS